MMRDLHQRSFWHRYRVPVLILYTLLTVVFFYGGKRAWDSNSNRIEDWLPASFDETADLVWFVSKFGSDELLMISWEGCTLDDPRSQRLARRLLKPATSDGKSYFSEVYTGPGILEDLQAEPLNLTEDEALSRMQGWMLGPDGKQTCVVALISAAGAEDRQSAVESVFAAAENVDGLNADALHVAGPTYDGVAIDNASKSSLLEFNLCSFAVCLGLLYLCLRRIWLALLVFLLAIVSQQMSMAVIFFTGTGLDSVLLLVANLTFVLGISSGVHFANYYLDALRDGHGGGAVRSALHHAWKPSLLGALTTGLGLASLMWSSLTPVVNFGMYSAISVILGAGILLSLLPSQLEQWPLKMQSTAKVAGKFAPFWQSLAGWVTGGRFLIIGTAVVLLSLGAFGVSRLKTSVRLHDLFSDDARVVADYAWLESNIGPLVPIEIVLDYPPRQPGEFAYSRLTTVSDIQAEMNEIAEVKGTLSALNFAPTLPPQDEMGFRAISQRRIMEKRIEDNLDFYRSVRFLNTEGERELWRISVRVNASDQTELGQLTRQIRQRVDSVVAQKPGVAVRYSGSIPLIYKAQSQMLTDLIVSFALAFGSIAVVMIWVFRSPVAGTLSMLPNALPSLTVFGVMGWMGLDVEIGSMLTASAAMGVAVDDTLHFITWFRTGLDQGRSRTDAVAFAYSKSAVAMVQTTLICSLGLLVFSLSPFRPISRFAWLMFTLLSFALICDLLLLPAILAIAPKSAFKSTTIPGEST